MWGNDVAKEGADWVAVKANSRMLLLFSLALASNFCRERDLRGDSLPIKSKCSFDLVVGGLLAHLPHVVSE